VTEEGLERIRSWLSPTEFDSEGSEYQKHLNAHASGTGLWLFQTEQYKNWHDLESGALWIQGIPGSGKSVVAANLIQTLKTENAPVLFFFSRRIIKSNSNPRNLVQDCLYQLLSYSPVLQRSLEILIKQHPDVSRTPFHELWKILLLALTTVPKVYLLFDALDELAVEEGDFLRCLLELGQQKSASIKLLITSRALPYLQDALSDPSIAIVRLTGRKVNRDIAIYIMHRIVQQHERILTTEDQSMIKDVLCERSKDLFLYARLMLDEILKQSIPVSVHVQQLPLSLGDMYVDLLHEHSARSGASLHFQSKLLSWITHSSRPLRTTDLAALINLHSDRCGLADSQDAKTMIRTSCGPLLEILDDETVQVIHHSFTEFLLDNSRSTASETLESEKWFPAFMPAVVHRSMTLSCLDYLMSGCFESWSVAENSNEIDSATQKQLMIQFHFLQYSSQNLLYHAAKCDPSDAAFVSTFDRFLKYGSHDFESWKSFWFSKTKNSVYDNFQPLHVAAQAGLTAYTVHLLGKGQNPDLVDSHGLSPVAYCAMHGHAETMAALLDHGASITIDDLDGLTPIHHAAKGNHVKALQSLLDAGADPMSPKSKEDSDYSFHSTLGKTPVQYACELGNAAVIPVLLQRLNPDIRSEILPHWATETGQARVLSMLLEYPEILANINKKDICGNTALYLAARVKDSSSVRILLQYGADVHLKSFDFDNSREKPASCESAENSLGFTPLQGWAHVKWHTGRDEHHNSVEEWEKTCILLIEAGSDIEARDEKGQTILFAWPEQLNYGYGDSGRSERFVSLLLRHHANPSATDDKGNTPLHQPRRRASVHKVIELLTRAGADINVTRDGDLVTPLIAAAKSQCTDVKEYIDHGADPNMQDSDGNTALHHICRSWCLEFEHILEWLTFGDPTIKNHKGETCIYNLRWGNGGEGRVRAIPLLVEKGLDLESKDRKGRTALLAACQNAEPHFIHGLIRYGADAKSRDFQNKSCK
jgi:ankyrin repeat protein